MGIKWVKKQRENKKSPYYLWELKYNANKARQLGRNKDRAGYATQKRQEKIDKCGIFQSRLWNEKEIRFLENNYLKLSLSKIALKLERSYLSISRKMNKLKLRKNYNWHLPTNK